MNRQEKIIEKGIAFLIVFPVVTFGAVQPWSMAITEIAAFIVGAAGFLLYLPFPAAGSALPRPLKWCLLLFLGVVILSLVPLPNTALSFIAPGTASLYASLADNGGSGRLPLSMTPYETLSGLWLLIACAAVFRTVSVHVSRREQVTGMVRTVMLTGTALAIFALVQKLFWTGKIYWFYPVAAGVSPFGPFINRNHGAAYLGMVSALGITMWLYEMARFEKGIQAPALSHRSKAYALLNSSRLKEMSLGLVAALVCAGGLFLTLSRGAMLSFAGAAVFFLFAARSRRSLRHKERFIVFIAVLLFLLIVAAGWSVISSRLETITNEPAVRLDIWADAIPLVNESPVLGTGLGTFGRRFPLYQTGHGTVMFEHAESMYLELLIEAGILGLAALVAAAGIFGSAIYRRWRHRKDSFVVIMGAGLMAALVMPLLHSFTDFHLIVPAVAMLFSILLGLLYAVVVRIRRADRLGSGSIS